VAGLDAESLEAFAHRKATTAFILAICSFVLCPFVAAVGAVIVGHQARRMYRDHPELPANSLVLPALVLGWLGVAFGIAALIYAFG